MKEATMGMVCCAVALSGLTQEIGYVETFSLADDREAALRELVPGTDDYHYYHALHAQNTGARDRFLEIAARWQRERDGNTPEPLRELLNRQALLDYGREPQATLDYLRRELGLTFSHAQKTGERANLAPFAFDEKLLAPDALKANALRDPRSLGTLSDAGLAFAAGLDGLTGEQRRHLLSRLSRPDLPNLVGLVAADLAFKDSKGFGHHPVHALMTLEQLDALAERMSKLRDETPFVTAYLAKLAPENEADIDTDSAARLAYLERLWAFVKPLAPVHNSLKANVLYNRLRHDLTQGAFDRVRFLEYLALPRRGGWARADFDGQSLPPAQLARLGQDFKLVAMPPVPVEEPLVRRFLLEFLKDAADTRAFEPHVHSGRLKELFAEAKIVNGVGAPQQWVPLLSPEAYARLKERVDIEFAEANPAAFGADDAVSLTAFVKNVPSLLVKVYEINTFNYYRETRQPLNLAVNLDGLVATSERRVEYAEPSERRVARPFDFPELKGRGVYVVELIGNGKSSRALVQKGRLDAVQEITPAGHAFTVFDEAGRRVTDAAGWLGGREFAPDAEGRIFVPFAADNAKKSQEHLVIRQGGFAARVGFAHLAETYSLETGTYVDREALIRREKAQIALRPVLRVNGVPTSLKLLEEVRLTVRATDLRGINTDKVFTDVALREDAETVQEIQVPEGTVTLLVELKAKVQNVSKNRKQEMVCAQTFALNGIERTARTQAFHMGVDADGYFADCRGKNGEPLVGRQVTVRLGHRYFRDNAFWIAPTLRTDGQGRIRLGKLPDVTSVTLREDGDPEKPFTWNPQRDACAYPDSLHGAEGETLRLAIPGTLADAVPATLLEKRGGQFVRDWGKALAVKERFLELRGLSAGDYSLWLKEAAREVTVRVTRGAVQGGYAVSPRRALELPRLAPLNVTAVAAGKEEVEIRLANVMPFARVHVVATRYLPTYDIFERLGIAGAGLREQARQTARTFYESGRDIGDEYRYILDRQQARKLPGNMLERPGLLLHPWSLRSTVAEQERLAAGNDYAGQAQAESSAAMSRMRASAAPKIMSADDYIAEGFASVDFLTQPAVTLLNLVPDAGGRVVVPRAMLKGLPCLRVLAVDPTATVLACAALEGTPMETRELRLNGGLAAAAPEAEPAAFTEQKLITPLQAGASVAVSDVTTARFERYDTVAGVYRLLATLNPDATFTEFAFVADWPGLDAAEQRRLYSKYACHELNLFLYNKAPRFFEQVVAPMLKNKRDKTFMDHWLLGDDLQGYLEPWRFARLNAAERALLGKRLRAQAAALARDARERADVIPPDMEAFNRRFDTAVQAGALEAEEAFGEVAAGIAVGKKGKQEERVPLTIALPKPQFTGTPKDIRSANLETPHQRGMVAGSQLMATSGAMDAPAEQVFFDGKAAERGKQRAFYQKTDKTQEWAENNYWHLPIAEQDAERVAANTFWADYAAHDGRMPFLSGAFTESTANFTEMMLALSVLGVPFKAGAHGEQVDGTVYSLKAGSPLVLFHREIKEGARPASDADADGILVAQHFFRADDRDPFGNDGRDPFGNDERVDKRVTDEFLPQVVYRAQVVLTNPTGKRRRLNALLQIPEGAIPVSNGFYTRGEYLALEPYSTQKLEYFFYFPATGQYPHYPVTVAEDGRVAGGAAPFTFNVVAKLSRTDTTSWVWVSQNGSEDDVIAFLDAANIHRIEQPESVFLSAPHPGLSEIAWRMKDKAFFKRVTALLRARHVYDDTLWSYAVMHNEPAEIHEYLRHSPLADRCGLWLESPLLALDPVERLDYQHLEYAPLVNPRSHRVGAKRTILNAAFLQQYQRLMKVLSYKPQLDAEDTLAVAAYMLMQGRVEDSLAWFGRVDRNAVAERLQCDYLEAYLAFHTGDTKTARALAERHAGEAVERWCDRFVQVLVQLDEIEGRAVTADAQGVGLEDGTGANRDRLQGGLAATEPSLEMLVEAGRVRLDTRNIATVTLNFYPMDIELLFSRSPFLQEGAAQFSFIRPVASHAVAVPAGQNGVTVDVPAEFAAKNVMVEALAGGVRKTQAYYANTLKVQMIESYGQLAVTQAESGKPVSGAYVKVYARQLGGAVSFLKDGYTDLRGRFDYVSLNSDEADTAERLAVLVLSDAFGAVVREAPPPKR